MPGALDAQAGLAVESTYGTAVTPSAFYEIDQGNTNHEWDPTPVQGTGLQVGDGGFARADRSASVIGQGKGVHAQDYQLGGMGKLINAFFGTGVSTNVSGTTYQQLFTASLASSLLPSQTYQLGVIRSDASGTEDAYTYSGVTFHQLQISCASSDVLKMTGNWDAMARTEATALATAAYPTSLGVPFHFGQLAMTYGGSVTVPTTTALATGGTAVTDVRNFTFNLDNQADLGRWRFGGRNQPRVSQRVATIQWEAEYSAVTYDQAQTGYTTQPLTLTATSAVALSTGFATWQLVLPATKITTTPRPGPSTSTPTVQYTASILKPSSGSAIYLVHRTADTAL